MRDPQQLLLHRDTNSSGRMREALVQPKAYGSSSSNSSNSSSNNSAKGSPYQLQAFPEETGR